MQTKSPGRRERPSKPALTREGTIAAALDILRTEGLGKVTMRRIAAALDTGAASLYVYIRDTDDLHAQILDALLDTVVQPTADGDWRERLKALLQRCMAVLFAYPDLARTALSTLPSGPNYLGLLEAILALLHEGGLGDREAAWAVDLLLLYATAQAAEKASWQAAPSRSDKDFASLATAIDTADPGVFSNIARLGPELLSGGPERLQWGFDVLLNGVLHTQRPDPAKELK